MCPSCSWSTHSNARFESLPGSHPLRIHIPISHSPGEIHRRKICVNSSMRPYWMGPFRHLEATSHVRRYPGSFPMDCPRKDGCFWVAFVVPYGMSAFYLQSRNPPLPAAPCVISTLVGPTRVGYLLLATISEQASSID